MSFAIPLILALVAQTFTLERVVAVVGSEPVLHSEVVTLMIESGIDQETAVNAGYSSASYQAALEQVIQEKLLVEAARREGVYPTRDEVEDAVDQSMEEARSGFVTEAQFTGFLASMGMTVHSLRNSYETILGDRIAGENFVRSRAGIIMASMPMDAETYFNENPALVEEVLSPREMSWIYIPVLPQDTGDAEEVLTQVRAMIEAGETTFSAAALEYSQDGSAASGGDLGWFQRGDMTATFEQQVYALAPGEIAGPFKTPFGVHLVKLTDRNEESVRASHILIISQSTPADLDSTLAMASRTVAEIQGGMDFATVARGLSADPETAESGGYLGTVNVGNWDGALYQAVIDLEPGDVSTPVVIEQSSAVAIFKRLSSDQASWEDFSQEELDAMLQSVFWNSYYDTMVDSLRSSIPVLVNIDHAN